jgi:hypothetical protein
VDQGIEIPFRKIVYFKKACFYCGQMVVYSASWEIKIKAEKPEETFLDIDNLPIVEKGEIQEVRDLWLKQMT